MALNMSQTIIYAFCFVWFISNISCQISNELDVDDIKKQVNSIPGLESFNASKLPSEEDVERLIKEKCEKNGGGEEAFLALKNQQAELQACLEAQVNVTVLQQEIEESKKTGSMDEVFGKYCKKYPEIHQCMQGVTDKVRPCLNEAERATLNKTLKVVEELKEFVCFKDGDRIAMFIAEGGVECMESKKEELQACANKTLGSRIPTDMSIDSLPVFLFTERECHDFDKIRSCFNEELEKCKDSTPANIVDAFFKFLKKHLPCDNILSLSSPTAASDKSSSSIARHSVILLVTMVIFKLF